MSSIDQFPRPLNDIAGLFENLLSDAVEQAAKLSAQRKHAHRTRQGEIRRPGEDTPLWNALIAAVRPHLVQWGAKSNLARVLGVPRQRIYQYITRPTAMPDAETVLHLVLWLANQEKLVAKGRHAQPVA